MSTVRNEVKFEMTDGRHWGSLQKLKGSLAYIGARGEARCDAPGKSVQLVYRCRCSSPSEFALGQQISHQVHAENRYALTATCMAYRRYNTNNLASTGEELDRI